MNRTRLYLIYILLAVSCFAVESTHSFLCAQTASKEEEALYVAQKAIEDGFYDVALTLLERFLKNYPSSFKINEVNLLIGQCYFHQGRFLDALHTFEALLSQPDAQQIKDAVFYWIAEVHFRGNNFDKAASYYKMIIEKFPKSSYLVAANYSLGWCLFQDQKFSDALQYFKIIEEQYPREPQVQDAYVKIVECLYNLKDYKTLKDKLKSYLKLFAKDASKSAYFYFYLAEADYYLNNFTDAIDEYNKALAATNDNKIQALSKLGLGWAFLKLKQYPQAQKTFLEIRSDHLEKRGQYILLLGKAILSFELKNFTDAKDTYHELVNTTADSVVLIQACLGEADALYNLGSYGDAEKLYKDALAKVTAESIPNEIIDKLHYGLAWTYFKQGEFKDAIKEFQKIVKQSEDKIVKISALCQIGDAYQDSGEFELAQETYDSILRDYPDSLYNDYAQYQLGLTLLKASNYDGAIVSFSVLKRNFSTSKLLDDAAYALGLAYFQKQDYSASREIFEKFQDEYKESPLLLQSLYLLGTSLYNLGKFAEAIEIFKNIIRVYTQDVELCQKAEYEIADCYYQMGDEKEAMFRFKALRTKYPDSSLSPEIMWWLGEYYYRHNDLNLANRYFLSLIQDFPKSNLVTDAYYILGSISVELEKFKEAFDNFNKVIEAGRSDLSGQAAIAIADIYVKLDKIDLAFQSYQESAKNYPNLKNLIFPKIADLYFQIKNYDEAIEYYRKSLDIVPVREIADIQFKIAETRQTQGKIQEAIEEYLKVTYLYPENTNLVVKALLRVAKVYEDKENFKEASSIYAKIIAMEVEESKYAQERLEWLKTQKNN